MKFDGWSRGGQRRRSPPSRRRGLKYICIAISRPYHNVASFPEAWIEIIILLMQGKVTDVASFPEAWIEITITVYLNGSHYGRLLLGGVD